MIKIFIQEQSETVANFLQSSIKKNKDLVLKRQKMMLCIFCDISLPKGALDKIICFSIDLLDFLSTFSFSKAADKIKKYLAAFMNKSIYE